MSFLGRVAVKAAINRGQQSAIAGSSIGGILKLGARAAWGSAKMATRLARQGPAGRALVGAGIGAGVGYFGSDFESEQLTLEASAKGAAMGALAGGFGLGALRMAGRAGISRTSRQLAWGGAKMGAKTGRFAFEHPIMLAAGAGALWAGSTIATPQSPTITGARMNANIDQQAAAVNELTGGLGTMGMGVVAPASQGLQQFQNSTMGLVGGLHRGRHG